MSLLISCLLIAGFWAFARRFTLKPRLVDSIPGPKRESWLFGNLLQLLLSKEYGEYEFQWQDAFGPCYAISGCFGETRLIVSDPATARFILNSPIFVSGASQQKAGNMLLGFGTVFLATGDRHKYLRSLVNPAFSPKSVREAQPVLREVARKLVEAWNALGFPGNTVDVLRSLHDVAMESIGDVILQYPLHAFDRTAGESTSAKQRSLIDSVSRVSKASLIGEAVLAYIPDPVFRLATRLPFPPMSTIRDYARLVDDLALQLIEQKRKDEGFKEDRSFLSDMIRVDPSDPTSGAPDEEIGTHIRTMLFAGADTSGGTLSWIVYELAKRPGLQSELRAEIGRTEMGLEFVDYDAMPLLNTIINETIRLYAALPFAERVSTEDCILPLSQEVVTNTGKRVTEIPIQKGQLVYVSLASYNRLKSLWGPDAGDFRPARWLEKASPCSGTAIGPHASLLSFLAGPGTCLGWRFAILQFQIVVVDIVRHFVLSLPGDDSVRPCYRHRFHRTMAVGSRKQITYAHKRNRMHKPTSTTARPLVSASSPLPQLDDSEYTSKEELHRRLRKRARRSSNPESMSKKLKPSLADEELQFSSIGMSPSPPPATPTDRSQFETPLPSALTEGQVFKLKSSRPSSPHPSSPPIPVRRTASHKLKENAVREPVKKKMKKKGGALDSPFNSRPGSVTSSPQNNSKPTTTVANSMQKKSLKRTLSDTNYNPNIPHSSSTANSPVRPFTDDSLHSPLLRTRRPSAPSPPRWSVHANSSFDCHFNPAAERPFFLPSATAHIDFNRPPSSMSFYGDSGSDSEEGFFADAQGISTPARDQRAYMLGQNVDMDMDVEGDEMDEDDDITPQSHPGMKDLPARTRSPWLSDSIVSPPTSQEWDRPPLVPYSPGPGSEDVDMYDELSLELGLGPPGFGEKRAHTEMDLKQMFDDMALGTTTKNRVVLNRTRSLDSSTPAEEHDGVRPAVKGRDRRGTIRASDFKTAIPTTAAPPRRTRSGTVIGPPTRARSSSSAVMPGTTAIGEASEDEEIDHMCSEGWAVADPPSPVVSRRHTPLEDSFEFDELDLLARPTSAGLMPAPVLFRADATNASNSRKPRSITSPREIAMEEEDDGEDDPLLLKPRAR
ncbi:unnamed protein product [Mycena citricolor]|uniref:Cytochrome P450 n=1 Tax=Mycena citricolor TaxID=2018698 RepID=A0AAD2HJY3_9AGAR|nr:unnamed protein product [Mycena citricolor]